MSHAAPTQILQTLQGYHASAVLNAAIELGAFRALESGPHTAGQVARAIHADERGTAILLDAVAALGFMDKEGKRYSLNPVSAEYLVPGRPAYAGDAARVVCDPMMWGAMGNLALAVRHGGTVLHQHAETPNHRFWDTFAASSNAFTAGPAAYAEGILSRFLSERPHARILDLACGSGFYGFFAARSHPGVRVVSQDRASVLAQARKNAVKMGVSKRVTWLAGDMFALDLGGPYDAVIASHVFHHFNLDTCARLLKRLAAAIAPGGRILIHDFVPDEARSSPAAALFAAVMLAWTREGNTYSYSEYKKLFTRTGFTEPVLHAPPHLTTQFLVGERRRKRSRR
jgi:C-methyltransferase